MINLFRAFLLFLVLSFLFEQCKPDRFIENQITINNLEQLSKEFEWEMMYVAICQIESEFNPNAVNAKTGASGIAQLMPIYVKEANRLSSCQRFTLQDRFDEVKTREMFEIIQSHHNKDKCIHKAIRLHNPRGGNWYYNKVMNVYREIMATHGSAV